MLTAWPPNVTDGFGVRLWPLIVSVKSPDPAGLAVGLSELIAVAAWVTWKGSELESILATRTTTFTEPTCWMRAFGTRTVIDLSLIHISEPTRLLSISYAVFCLKK